jgi:hypothetical protein
LATSTRTLSDTCSIALSVLSFSPVFLPARGAQSAVMTTFASQSFTRFAKASGEKPPKTTE